MKKFFTLLSLLLLIFSQIVYAQPKILTFATDPTYAPFEYYDYTAAQIRGYDVDIVNALCAQMKVQCKFESLTFNQLIPGLKKGDFDAVIRALSITPARQREVDFTRPYFNTTGSFVAASASNLTLSNQALAGKIIGVQQGTTFEVYLYSKYGRTIYIKPYKNIQSALSDLSQGTIAAVLGDTPVIKNWINNQPSDSFDIIGQATQDRSIFGTGFGIAVRKGNTALLNSLNQALAKIKADGTYARITREYFGDSGYTFSETSLEKNL